MSNEEIHVQHAQHAFLVVWGWFAEHIGLIAQLEHVPLKQKHYHHKPQTKVLEFLVAISAGLRHLQDMSRVAHPLDQDQAVAEAWGQPAWADYSGVSQTLSRVSWTEARQMAAVLDQVSQPYLEAEVKRLQGQGQRLRLDGDLTGLPVSNTSQSYPHAAFGHMNAEIRLGYQAGVVNLESPTYGTYGCRWPTIQVIPFLVTQAEALVLAAEARLGRRSWRRIDLLRQRLQAFEKNVEFFPKVK
ncbi:MAG: hypothetical protein KJ077_25545 [Anaerolineae bacterium]|nr:hypothetical protein [Anaerolineae bacterium]